MLDYEPPRVLASYDAEELRQEAAECVTACNNPPVAFSDASLKDDVAPVGGSLERLQRVQPR